MLVVPFNCPLVNMLKICLLIGPNQQARAHMHLIGKTGSGKSFFLASLYISLLKAGFGVTLIDPHGTLSPLIFSLLAADGFFEQEDAYEKLLYLDLATAE